MRRSEMKNRVEKREDRVSDSRLFVHFRDLDDYKSSFSIAIRIYENTKDFPA